jgi:PIN domain nuclease of toxin-antitoxin system
VKLLLDTQIWLWLTSGDHRLTPRIRDVIEDCSNTVALSVVSACEIAIKTRLGKLALPMPPRLYLTTMLARQEIGTLPVMLDDATAVADLPDVHRDPFDRLLVAQSIVNGLTLVSADPIFTRYSVDLISA